MDVTMLFLRFCVRQRATGFFIPAVGLGRQGDAYQALFTSPDQSSGRHCVGGPAGALVKIGPGPDTSFVLANFDPYLRRGEL